jgi:hypothetical protein
MYAVERFVVEERILRQDPDDAIRIVRLGALANAITSTIGMLLGSRASSTGRQRDLLQGVLILVSYFKEAVDQIDHHRPWDLIRKAVEGGYQLPKSIEDLRQTFSRSKTSFYKKKAIDIRRKKGFHVDAEHFQDWLKQLQAPYVTLWRRDGPAPTDRTFTASAQVQSFFGQQLQGEDLQIVQDITVIPQLVEAIVGGLLIENDVNPRRAYIEMKPQFVRIEYSFNDGRPPASERIVIVCDASGFLEGVIHELRDHVTRRFGGNRVGAMLLGPSDPVTFSSSFGTAKGWADGIAESLSIDNVEDVTLELVHMAEAGKRAVEESLKLAEFLRKTGASMPDLGTRLDHLRIDHQWWSGQLQKAESRRKARNQRAG